MAKICGDNFKFLLFVSSLFLNLYLVYLFYGGDAELTWTRKAARDAEDAASVKCSDHGRAFLDGIREGGKPVCECYGCFTGLDCSEFRPENCAVQADSGDPLFLERFWMQHEWGGAVMVSGWHRMGYLMGDNTLTSAELERHIRLLHSVIGNANTTGKYVVFGVGAMQLLNAAVHALSASPNASASPARVVSTPPHYPAYRIQTTYFNGRSYVWKGATQQFLNESDPSTRFVEFVTSPNNPTGELRDTHLKGPSASAIFDRVYYWPHFSAIPSPADDDLMIFSLGKVSGHAGSRFGWALVKDKGVYDRLSDYVGMNVLGVSHDTQLRALMVIKAILGGGEKGKKLFEFGHKTLRVKWRKLNHVFSKSGRFSLQKLPSQYCTYFKTIREPSPAYAWVKCEREAEKECQGVLSAAGIVGNNGNWFGADTAHVRISLTKSEEEFDLMLDRFEKLVAEEKGGETVRLTNGAQTKQMKQVI